MLWDTRKWSTIWYTAVITLHRPVVEDASEDSHMHRHVPIWSGEVFYLRALLIAASFFTDLCTVNKYVFGTFHKAESDLGLFKNNQEDRRSNILNGPLAIQRLDPSPTAFGNCRCYIARRSFLTFLHKLFHTKRLACIVLDEVRTILTSEHYQPILCCLNQL
jgi:hypothetical protein